MFFPDEYLDSAYVIDYDRLYREGYRGLIYDIDNTLVPHGHRQMSGQLHFCTFERTWIWLLSVVKQSD